MKTLVHLKSWLVSGAAACALALSAPAFAQAAGKVQVQWLGQAAFKITTIGGSSVQVMVMQPDQTLEF